MNNFGFNIPYQPMVINGFVNATRDILNRIKLDFELASEVEAFIPLQNYFRSVELREPTSEELRLYDALVMSRAGEPSDAVITSLAIEKDISVARTFEDLKNKIISKNGFISLTDLFSAADYVLNTVAPTNNTELCTYCGNNAAVRSALLGSSDTILIKTDRQVCAVGIGRKPTNLKPIGNGDCYMFVTKDTTTDFVSSLCTLISAEKEALQIKYADLTDKKGLLYLILDAASGGSVDIAALQEYNCEMSVSVLLKDIADSALVVIPEYLISIFAATAQNYGLRSIKIGNTSSVKRLTVTCQGMYPTSFATDFLRSVIHRVRYNAVIPAQPDASITKQNFSVESNTSDYAINSNELSVTAISAKPTFKDTLFSILEAVCRLVSCGVPYKDIRLSLCTEMDLTNNLIGDIIAMLLGAYRAQAELAISSFGSICKKSDNNRFIVFAVGKSTLEPTKNEFTKSDSRVYLIAPRKTDEDLPDFRDERLLLGYVNKIISEKKVLSARAVSTEKVAGTIKIMCGNNFRFESVNTPEYAECGSFIVETDAEIDGLLLGYTREIK